jgi:hypothetical protein
MYTARLEMCQGKQAYKPLARMTLGGRANFVSKKYVYNKIVFKLRMKRCCLRGYMWIRINVMCM